jgi:hypothetical protein
LADTGKGLVERGRRSARHGKPDRIVQVHPTLSGIAAEDKPEQVPRRMLRTLLSYVGWRGRRCRGSWR